MSQGPSLSFDSRIFLAVAAVLLVVIAVYNLYIALVTVLLLAAGYWYGRRRYIERQAALTAYLESMRMNIDQASVYALQNLPLAIAIADEDGYLHWHNHMLARWLGERVDRGDSLRKVWPDLPLDSLWEQEGKTVFQADGQYYQVIYKPIIHSGLGAEKLIILYITDVTESETVRAACYGSRPVIAQVQIDNYDDVLKGLSESRRTTILAEVNQRLDEWVSANNGFLKKYTEDMYLAVFQREALDHLMANKFDILDKIRTIHGGNKIPVTLSMGVAADEATVAALAQRAQAGLDLALSRGGDQAAVYVEGRAQFYGGKAKAVEKNTRVKARLVAQAIREMIHDSDQVFVMGHAVEDFDSLGAAIGITKMAHHMAKPVNIVVSQPGLSVSKLSELLPEYAEYQNVFITPAQALNQITSDTLLFIVDTHRPGMTAAPDILNLTERKIVIDHHRRSEVFISNPLLVYMEPSASSTSELITELLMYFDDKLDMSRLEASALYAGIIVDTKNFAVQTGVRTFEAASYLRRAGADPALVRQLFRVDFDTLRARAEIITASQVLPGGVIIAVCPKEVRHSQIVAAQAADMLLNIEGTRVTFVLFYNEDSIGVSARSQGDVNVQVILELMGGGGHQTVAGVQVKNASLEDVKAQIIELVTKYLEESEQNETNSAARSEKPR